MYSRNYGFIEQSGQNASFYPPADYHGNFYRKPETDSVKPAEVFAPEKNMEEKSEPVMPLEEKKPSIPSGLAGSFLERLTAEDILLFVFLYSLLRGEEESGTVLGLILALLLL